MTNPVIDPLIQHKVIRPAHYVSLLVNNQGHRLPYRSSYMFVWLNGPLVLLLSQRRVQLRHTCSFISCLSLPPARFKSVAVVLCNSVLMTFKYSYWVITSWHKTLVKHWSDSLQVILDWYCIHSIRALQRCLTTQNCSCFYLFWGVLATWEDIILAWLIFKGCFHYFDYFELNIFKFDLFTAAIRHWCFLLICITILYS